MGTNKQLPPELVEKMWKALNSDTITLQEESNACAQIAVDYADDWKRMYELQKSETIEAIKQRDELIECLKGVHAQFRHLPESADPNSWKYRILELLKKHEDGKD